MIQDMTMPSTIGSLLKARREELGFSLSQMSEKTKVPLHKLQAIEDDNIAYFKDEITYLKFYVRYYFNALHLNFEEYKDQYNASVDHYTESAQLVKTQEMRELHQRVATGANARLPKKAPVTRKQLKKPMWSDLAFISMIVIGLVVVLALLFIFFQTVLPLLSKAQDNQQVIVVPDPIDHETDPVDDPDDPDEPVVFTVTKTSQVDKNGQLTNYEVTGYTEGDTVTIEVEIKSAASWVSSKVDGISTVNPPRRDYVRGEIYTLIVTAQLDRTIEIYIGNLKSQILRINGSVIEMDPQLLEERPNSSFYFRFVESNP
jgi:cytoskeletal protein RodZ